MLKTVLAVVLSLFAAGVFAQATFEAQDVGEIYQTNTGHSTILFNNIGDKPVKILSVTPATVEDKIGDFKLPATVAPKTSVNIPVLVFDGMESGHNNHLFKIETDIAKHPSFTVPVHLFSLSVLDDPKPRADLGTVNVNTAPPVKTVILSSREVPDFRITGIVATPDFATARIEPDGKTVSITGKADAAWGSHDGYVKVALNSNVQPQAWIQVTADVHGAVIPSSDPVDMGVFHNTKLPFVVQLKSRDGKPVRLGKVELDGFRGQLSKEPCVGSAAGCAQIGIKVSDQQSAGVLRGKLLVDLPDFHRQLPIRIGGIYMPESIKVHSLNEAMEKNSKASTEAPSLDLKSALQKSTQARAATPPADPPGHGPLLKWQVSNENNVYGYLVYRGDAENGPFLRVNKDIVHVDGDKGDGVTSTYSWRDNSATAGKTYWYYVGLLNRDGTKQQLSGPQEVKAK